MKPSSIEGTKVFFCRKRLNTRQYNAIHYDEWDEYAEHFMQWVSKSVDRHINDAD
jgi:hypothetical protein